MAGPSRRLLLAAAVLGSCLQPAPAQSHIALTPDPPPAPQVGGAVTLALQPPQSLAVCTWYRAAESVSSAEILTYVQDKGQRNGPSYTGRETGRPDCSLHITGLMLNDSSPYFLWMPTTGSKITVTLAVYGMLSQPKVTLPNPMVVENRTLKLTCEAPSRTETLLWDHDGYVVVPGGRVGLSPGNRTLTVQGVCRDDAGNYTCEVRNPVSHNRSHPVTVTVAYGPDAATVAPPGPLDRAVGSALGLMCEAGSVPAPRYGWFHNDTELSGAGETLNLTELGWGQQGTYRCVVHNPVTGLTAASRPLDLRLWEMLLQPKVISSNFTVVENRTLNLTCEAPPSTETLLWDRDGSVLVPGGRVELSTGNRTLTVPGVGRDDAGNYTCEVRNPINTVRSKGVIVTVIYGPVAAHITLTGPLHPLLGDNVTLTCAADSFPAPQFHWSHNGSDLVPALTSAVLSLVLRGAEQTGVFECHATNPHTGRRATTSVSIGLGPGLGQQAGSLSGGTIAGIIIGTLVGLGLLVFVFYYFWGQSKRHSKKPVQTGSRTPVAPHGPDVTRSGPLKEEEVSYSSVAFRAGGLQTPRPQGPAKADTTVYAEVKKK